MSKFVKATRMGITHYQALCLGCSWSEAGHHNREWVRSQVRKHVRKTGHEVTIEKGVATHYELKEIKLCECGKYFKVWLNGENKPVEDWCGECIPF